MREGSGRHVKHDVFLARPQGWRNQVWETDHVQAPLLVDVDGQARRPWITWFTDCATNAITGVAVTPVHPSREPVLAALRSAVVSEEPYGQFGGLPEKVRVDRGKDFLSRTVTAAFDLLDVTVEDLPAYTPHLKGTVEGLWFRRWERTTFVGGFRQHLAITRVGNVDEK
ncbi:hypothetical protein SPURM210S_04382 [Streptomyces purpurascens]